MGLEEPWPRVRVLFVLRSAGRGRNVELWMDCGVTDVTERSIYVIYVPDRWNGTMLLAMMVH